MKINRLVAYSLPLILFVGGCAGSRSRLTKAKTAGDEIVEAEGMAPYKSDDLPGTKAAALAAAERSAVEKVVGVYVDARTRVDKAVSIEDRILTNAQGYVKKYEILSEGRSGDWYKMRIRALVATGQIHERLDSLGLLRQPSVGNPRVALLLQEWIGEKNVTGGEASRAMTQGLLDRGFQVVELPASIDRSEDPTEIAKTMSRGQAELLVAGLARAQSLGYGQKAFGGLSSYRASISCRVLEVGTGEVLTTVSETASGLEGTPDIAAGKALAQVGQMGAVDMADLPRQLADRAHVSINISGITSFDALGNFEKSLSADPGVKDLYLRSFDQAVGQASLDAHIQGVSLPELADRCVKIGGSTWSVYQIAGRTIQLSASLAGH
jgi:hypothetical protein